MSSVVVENYDMFVCYAQAMRTLLWVFFIAYLRNPNRKQQYYQTKSSEKSIAVNIEQ